MTSPPSPSAPDQPSESQTDLVARVRGGDVRAFEEIFRAHYEALCGFARRYVGDDGTAEELVQDVFATIWTRRAEWSVATTVRSYLFGAVRNRALNRRKRAAMERDWVHEEAAASDDFHLAPDDSQRLLETDELRRRLDSAIDTLPERCRLVIQLRWRDQLSYAEIAEVMGISVKGVENQLSRGLKALRECLIVYRKAE